MTTAVVFQEQVEIPYLRGFAEFRAWVHSEEFPASGRIDYVADRIEVDMSPEDLFTHGRLKTHLVSVLHQRTEQLGTGYVFSDCTRISAPAVELSVEPDIVFLSKQSIRSGSARLVPKASGEAGRYIEIEGAVDLIVEIVSDASVRKDLERLPAEYFRAGVREYWLADARGREFSFSIQTRGPDGFVPAPRRQDSQWSDVLGCAWRVSRHADDLGLWDYDVLALV